MGEAEKEQQEVRQKQLQVMIFYVQEKATLTAIAFGTIVNELVKLDCETSENAAVDMAIAVVENTYTSIIGQDNEA